MHAEQRKGGGGGEQRKGGGGGGAGGGGGEKREFSRGGIYRVEGPPTLTTMRLDQSDYTKKQRTKRGKKTPVSPGILHATCQKNSRHGPAMMQLSDNIAPFKRKRRISGCLRHRQALCCAEQIH